LVVQPAGGVDTVGCGHRVSFDLVLAISKDHAMAVLYGDVTPLTSRNALHHPKGHNQKWRSYCGHRYMKIVLYRRKDLRTTMAQQVRIEMVDDMDGSEATQTVPFSLDGVNYEIDLSDVNAIGLRDELANYIAAGRRTGGRKIPAAAETPTSPVDRERSRAIRAWGQVNGYAVSARGRIPAEIVAAYDRDQLVPALSKKQQSKTNRTRSAKKKTTASG
jgi:Lsr2